MAMIWAEIRVEVEVSDDVLKEYDGDAFTFMADSASVDVIDGKYLSYEVTEVDTDY